MHVSAAVLKWEHSIYNAIYRNDPHLMKLLSWQVNNVGSGYCSNGKLKYKVKGKRFSGDMNTALGNCEIACGLIYTYAKMRGVHVKLGNNGDDCAVFMESADREKFMEGFAEQFLRWGFRMTVEEPVFEFSKIEFCQMRPIWNGRVYTMVRNIPTALAKDALCTLPLTTERMARQWIGAVGECGLALTTGIPIMQSFYECLIRNGIHHSTITETAQFQSGLRMMRGDLESISSEISAEARLQVYIAWGITPDEQIAFEEYYDSWSFEYSPVDIDPEPPLLFNVLSLPW